MSARAAAAPTPPPASSTIRVVECSGAPRDLGVSQGRACSAEIARLPQMALALFGVDPKSRAGRVAARLAGPLYAGGGRLASAWMDRPLGRAYPRLRARLHGIAEGAGVAPEGLYLGPAVEALLNQVSYRRAGACTALAVTGRRAASGEPIIAKNFDYPPAASDSYLVRVSRPVGAAASIDVTAAPLPGCHEGVNEHGLAVAYNYAYLAGRAGARVTITSVVQDLLEECRSVDQALDRLARSPRTGSALLMLADAAGHVASVEVAPDAIAVRRAADHGDALVHANHALTAEMAPRDVPQDAIYSHWNVKALRGQRVHESSERRQAHAEALVRGSSALGSDALRGALADHGHGAGDDHTVCRHGDYYATTLSVLLYPRRRSIEVVLGAPCESPWTTVAL